VSHEGCAAGGGGGGDRRVAEFNLGTEAQVAAGGGVK
jgi:hypothetical protein